MGRTDFVVFFDLRSRVHHGKWNGKVVSESCCRDWKQRRGKFGRRDGTMMFLLCLEYEAKVRQPLSNLMAQDVKFS